MRELAMGNAKLIHRYYKRAEYNLIKLSSHIKHEEPRKKPSNKEKQRQKGMK